MADKAHLVRLTKTLMDRGLLIEAGWVAYRIKFMPQDATAQQLNDAKFVYMAGAQHLWSSLMNGLDDGDMETPADLQRMDLIARELESWQRQVEAMLMAKGSKQ